MLTHRHVLPPLLLGRVARHRLVQNARSRSNSKTASLHPERKSTCAVHAPAAYCTDSNQFSCLWVGRTPMSTQNPSMSAYRVCCFLSASAHVELNYSLNGVTV